LEPNLIFPAWIVKQNALRLQHRAAAIICFQQFQKIFKVKKTKWIDASEIDVSLIDLKKNEAVFEKRQEKVVKNLCFCA